MTDINTTAATAQTLASQVDWDKCGGLLPAIAQDEVSGTVLMLGFMNHEALLETGRRGRVVFYSRTRQCLWEKGETSGNFLELRSMQLDCDNDSLLCHVSPAGPVCHTGSFSCFGSAQTFSLATLERVIALRDEQRTPGSYTAKLLSQGLPKVAQKVGEEGVEVALAAVVGDDPALLGESADLLYHLLVLLRARSLSLAQVISVLAQRHA